MQTRAHMRIDVIAPISSGHGLPMCSCYEKGVISENFNKGGSLFNVRNWIQLTLKNI